MIPTVEAIVDGQGRVRLLSPVHVDGLRRALVTVLDESPEAPGEIDTVWSAGKVSGRDTVRASLATSKKESGHEIGVPSRRLR